MDRNMDNHRLSHAYIIASESEQRRNAEADRLAAALLCTAEGMRPCGMCRNCRKVQAHIHPDVTVIQRLPGDKGKLKREIYVEQIRSLLMELSVLPNEAEKKVYVIQDAETMNANAQNALLKGLEEPPQFVAFLLCTGNAGELLDTIRSRCVEYTINASEDSAAPSALNPAAETYLRAAATGRPDQILSACMAEDSMDNGEALQFVAAVRDALTDLLSGRRTDPTLSAARAMSLIRLMDEAEDKLRANVGVKHVLGLISVRTK